MDYFTTTDDYDRSSLRKADDFYANQYPMKSMELIRRI
jgi:hypothetical protein